MGKTLRLNEVKELPALETEEAWNAIRRQQKLLQKIQQAYLVGGQRAVIVLEGWDTAGKGGLVRRIGWALDPRSLSVWPISAPNAIERQQYYLQRFWSRLPEHGRIAIFDRSWYGRVLVERVENFATRDQWKRAYDEINHFEEMLVADGVRLVKLFLHITPAEQLNRFRERMEDPVKRWKLTPDDFRNREKWPQYVEAADEMFEKTSTKAAPWHVVFSDDKRAARVRALEIITRDIGRDIDLTPPALDPQVAEIAKGYF